MSEFIINGPTKLKGEVTISGSKNAALPIICAALLAKGKSTIKNVPEITDIKNLLDIINDLGVKTKLENNVCEIDASNLENCSPDPKKVRHIRASILLIGPLLARCHEVKIAHPGGCFIGARPIDTTLNAFESIGATIHENDSFYELSAKKLKGSKIILKEPTVTGTENLVMAAVLAEGTTEIRLAAAEPHVVDLCNFLNKMGAKISGAGTSILTIEGVKELKATNHTLIYDQIEAGTFALAIAASRGNATIKGFVANHQDILINRMKAANIKFEILNHETIHISPTTHFNPVKVRTDFYPNFPTDLQSPFAILMTQADGTSEIFETIFEGRLNYLNELNKMGANAVIKNSHEATITGPTPLYGTNINTLDLRAGATLIIAALIAEGKSIIDNAEIIDRGYEKIEEKLQKLGATIKRVELEKTT